jgi:hypothetical protein
VSSELIGQSFLVDPAAPLTGPAPKIPDGLPQGTPIEERLGVQLDETALRALRLIDQALSGKVDLGEQDQRTRLGLASSVLGAWSRYQQTQTARWALQMRSQEFAARPVASRLIERAQ